MHRSGTPPRRSEPPTSPPAHPTWRSLRRRSARLSRPCGEPVHRDIGEHLIEVDRVLGQRPPGSVHSWNFSTIHASCPTGESVSAYAMVWGFVPCRIAYDES
jgi:hypothetical protein